MTSNMFCCILDLELHMAFLYKPNLALYMAATLQIAFLNGPKRCGLDKKIQDMFMMIYFKQNYLSPKVISDILLISGTLVISTTLLPKSCISKGPFFFAAEPGIVL